MHTFLVISTLLENPCSPCKFIRVAVPLLVDKWLLMLMLSWIFRCARPSLHLACANSGVSDRMDVIVTGRYSVCHLTAKDYLNKVAANIRFISISCKFMASYMYELKQVIIKIALST